MAPIVVTILASVGGILVEKGLSFIKDIFIGLSDQGAVLAKDFIKEKTGVDVTSKEELSKLSVSDVEDIKQTILHNLDTLMDMKIKHRQQDLDNTVSARKMNTDLANMGSKGFFTFTNLIALILILFMVVFFPSIVFLEIPQENVRFADTIIGFMLGSVVGVVVNFYFGSSMATQEVASRSTRANSRATDKVTDEPEVIKKSFVK